MKPGVRALGVAAVFLVVTTRVLAQEVEVDFSACQGMSEVLEAMHNCASLESVSRRLDALLDTRPYQMMFKHYNRSWRPNHLPKPVFKRMILSLRFEGEYTPGENSRADSMLKQWKGFYRDPSRYRERLRALEAVDLRTLIADGIRYAQGWLPPEWKIPGFYLPVIPNGGSPAFAIEGTQGFDFLQLPLTPSGGLDLEWLVATISHESNHLGLRPTTPESLTQAEKVAYRVVSFCVAEGVATEFISGPPPGRVPAIPGARFHIFDADMTRAWNERVAEEAQIVDHLASQLDRATSGALTAEGFDGDLRDYWLSGSIGRAYVLGSEIFGAIDTAFGKEAVFTAMRDPRRMFGLYNAALDAELQALSHCIRIPEKTVQQAMAIGNRTTSPARD